MVTPNRFASTQLTASRNAGRPQLERVAAHGRLRRGVRQRLDRRGRRRQVGVAGAQVDDVHAPGDEVPLDLRDVGQG
jgi:hypothetical protein